MADQRTEELGVIASKCTTDIFDFITEKLRHPDGKDTSYLRAIFSHNRGTGDYGCTIRIEVSLNDYDKSAKITTQFGAKP